MENKFQLQKILQEKVKKRKDYIAYMICLKNILEYMNMQKKYAKSLSKKLNIRKKLKINLENFKLLHRIINQYFMELLRMVIK